MEKIGKLKGSTKGTAKAGKKGDSLKKLSKTMFVSQEEEKPVIAFKDPLNKDEQIVKTTLLKGGIYDSIGTKY